MLHDLEHVTIIKSANGHNLPLVDVAGPIDDVICQEKSKQLLAVLELYM